MPTVPRYQTSSAPETRNLKITGMPESSGLLSIQPDDSSATADALAGLGRQIGRTADTYASILFRRKEKEKTVDVINLFNDIHAQSEKQRDNIEKNYRGRDARGVTQSSAQMFDERVSRLMEDLPDDDTRLCLARLAMPLRNDLLRAASTHEARELDFFRRSVLSDSYSATGSALSGLAASGDAQGAENRIALYLGQVQAAYGGSVPEEKIMEQERLLNRSFLLSLAATGPAVAEKNLARFARGLTEAECADVNAAISAGKKTHALNREFVRAIMENDDEVTATAWVDSKDCFIAPSDKPALSRMVLAHFRTQERQQETMARKLAEQTHLSFADRLLAGDLSVFSVAEKNLDDDDTRAWQEALSGRQFGTDPETLGKALTSIYTDRKAKAGAVVGKINHGLSPIVGQALLAEHFAARTPEKTPEQEADSFWTAQAIEAFDEAASNTGLGISANQIRKAQARWFTSKNDLAGKDIYDSAMHAILAARQ